MTGKKTQASSPERSDERPSARIVMTPEAMEPVIEESSRTANKIREDLGLPARRYDLVMVDVYERVLSTEVLENVRVAVLQAVARSARDGSASFNVLEAATKRLLCWAVAGHLYVPERAGEASADEVVSAERRASRA